MKKYKHNKEPVPTNLKNQKWNAASIWTRLRAEYEAQLVERFPIEKDTRAIQRGPDGKVIKQKEAKVYPESFKLFYESKKFNLSKVLGDKTEEEKEINDEYFKEKHGDNFAKSHPEVFKLGKLRQAKLKFANGSYKDAAEKLKEGFKIASLKLSFDDNYKKRLALEAKMAKAEEAKAKLADTKVGSKTALTTVKKEAPKNSTVFSLDAMKQNVEDEDAQKKMPNENPEDKKLLPILREAYQLWCEIEQIKVDADKKIKKLEKQEKALNNEKEKQKDLTMAEDRAMNTKDLYKTIMCPLTTTCPKDNRNRWPMSSAKAVS